MLRDILNYLEKEFGSKSVLLCASGGVDSTVLAYLFKKSGVNFFLFYADSPIRSLKTKKIVECLSDRIEVPLIVENTEEYLDEIFRTDPLKRCYVCKKEIFHKAAEISRKIGINFICDGTNADDLFDLRPGLKAAKEYGVRSPLVEMGVGKSEIKELNRILNINHSPEPTTCFATRFPDSNKPVDLSLFKFIEAEEEKLKNWGFRNVRVRVYKDKLVYQVDSLEVARLFLLRNLIKYPLEYNIEVDPLGYRKLGETLKKED
ncbi:MAG: hypothetical protein N2440_01875 [Actinobacteria bacterium]|nr:hypothetical protein [Actinomycetota bacterium]